MIGAALMAAGTMVSGAVVAGEPAQASSNASFGELLGVYCTAAANCWAVGDHDNGTADLNEALHWTGHKWRSVSVPSPGGTGNGATSELSAVRCTAATNCWAVGNYGKSGSVRLNQALHWNGRQWTSVPVPSPGTKTVSSTNFLGDVSCTAASDCWAVGQYERGAPGSLVLRNLMLHWTGKKWFLVAVPNPGGTKPGDGNLLNSVRCASASDCWAAGSEGTFTEGLAAARPAAAAGKRFFFANQMLHWNGTKWVAVKVPSPGGTANGANNLVNGLSCTASTDCWAAGTYGSFNNPAHNSLNEVLHWSGKKWVKVSAPNPVGTGNDAGNQLNAIFCVTASNCWADGTDGIQLGGNPSFGEMLHWNGAKWSQATIPNTAGNGANARSTLRSIRCVSAADCWAVGTAQPDGHDAAELILHWTGKKWTIAVGAPL
jgi:hypothetical protein